MTSESDAKILRFCVVSDIHMNIDNVLELKKEIWRGKQFVDCLICGGDFLNVPHEGVTSAGLLQACEGDTSNILSHLEDIAAQVFWIPGNHDTASMLSTDQPLQLTQRSLSIHGRITRIVPGLCVGGLGGAVPSYTGDIGSRQLKWNGRPWTEDNVEVFQDKLREVVDRTRTKVLSTDGDVTATQDDTLILVTHSGPSGSKTTFDDSKGDRIYTGSAALSEVLRDAPADDTLFNIALSIHGHTHAGQGLDQVAQVPVLNPGPLRDGQYAVFTMIKEEGKPWRLHEHTLCKLANSG